MNKINEKLRAYRLSIGKTQAELANLLGINSSSVCRSEKYSKFATKQVYRILELEGWTFEYFITKEF